MGGTKVKGGREEPRWVRRGQDRRVEPRRMKEEPI